MAMYRKLGRKSDVRRALLRSQATALIANGKIITTEARAKEVRRVVEPLIALAAKEKDNFETVTVTAKVPKKDANGKRIKAAGGIASLEDAQDMLDLGASRLGTSRIVKIVKANEGGKEDGSQDASY